MKRYKSNRVIVTLSLLKKEADRKTYAFIVTIEGESDYSYKDDNFFDSTGGSEAMIAGDMIYSAYQEEDDEEKAQTLLEALIGEYVHDNESYGGGEIFKVLTEEITNEGNMYSRIVGKLDWEQMMDKAMIKAVEQKDAGDAYFLWDMYSVIQKEGYYILPF